MLLDQSRIEPAQQFRRAAADSVALWRQYLGFVGKRSFDEDDSQDVNFADSQALNLPGRYQVGDGNEFAGCFTEISPRGLRIAGPRCGSLGQYCASSLDGVGIVEGIVDETGPLSFLVGVIASPRRIQKVAKRLGWNVRKALEDLEERRSSERVELRHAKAKLKALEGREFDCQIFDISDGGAALHLGSDALYFWIDQPILLDLRPGRVLRHFPGGLVIKFE